MRQKRIIYLLLFIVFTFIFCKVNTKAQDVQETQIVDYGMSLFNWEAIEEVENQLKSTMPTAFDLKAEVSSMLSGEKRFSLENVLKLILSLLFREIGLFIQLGARFILIVLMCNMLQVLSSSFKSKETTKICFFVCYLVIIYSVIQSFFVMITLAQETIDNMCQIMFACIPTLLAFMTMTGYATSSAAMAPLIISALHISSYVIKVLVLPCIISVVVLEVISTMSEDFKVDKFIKLFYRAIKWILRSILLISVSILGFYRMTLPYVDMTVKKAALSLSTAFIPVIGSAVGGAVDFIMNCSSLIKNTFSIGVILWIVVLASMPLIKILAYVIVYQVAGAVIEPIGDKKMANIATKLAKGCEFIMSAVGIVALLCISVLLICMSVGAHVG